MEKLTKQQMEIVKREHPEWFNGIEVGKWYSVSSYRLLIHVNRIEKCNNGENDYRKIHYFGFDGAIYIEKDYLANMELEKEFIPATPEEVKQALIAEAKRRYKVGDRIKSLRNDWVHTIGEMEVDVCTPTKEWNHWVVTVVAEKDEWDKMYSNPTVFKDGQWASVIPQEKPSLQDDIQTLKDRWPDINFTIIAEGKK